MKILHVAFSFPPDPAAGTELYVDAICRALADRDVQSVVAAPAEASAGYDHDGLPVRRFAMSKSASLDDLYGGHDSEALAQFERILADERPDLVHQHALTSACSVELMRAAKRHGLPVVFTYHTPTTTCQRGTLLERGTTVCDGRLDAGRCTACTLHGLGLNQSLSRMVAHTPDGLGAWLDARGLQGGAWTALRIPMLMRHRLEMLQTFLNTPDRFVALAPWVRDLLCVNGVAHERIVMSRHGLRTPPRIARRARSAQRFRIAHLGRLDPVKGTDLLLRVIHALPNTGLELDIFGLLQSAADSQRLAALQNLAAGDARIRFLAPLPASQVVDTLTEYDLVAVPSQWLETGPLVVLEAHAAGVPVVGSALGGIADKITHGVDGLLVSAYASVDAWSDVIQRCATQPDLMDALRRGVRAPRSMGDVAREMADLYAPLVADAVSPVSRAG